MIMIILVFPLLLFIISNEDCKKWKGNTGVFLLGHWYVQ